MDIITIAATALTEDQIRTMRRCLHTAVQPLSHDMRLDHKFCAGRRELYCVNTRLIPWNTSEKKKILHKIAAGLAAFIMLEEEGRLLECLLDGKMDITQPEEISEALSLFGPSAAANSADTDRLQSSREKKLIAEIAKLLKEYPTLNYDGLLRFRLAAYKGELEELALYAAEEYAKEKQYKEFITLLKYFVFIQQSKIPSVHLMHRGGGDFSLLNEELLPIQTDESDAWITIEKPEKDMNYEDMIVSTLINVAPRYIHIHTREPGALVIQTIVQIFDGRVSVCGFCKQCGPYLGLQEVAINVSPLDLAHPAPYN
jgi:putative sporulation protein YtxC